MANLLPMQLNGKTISDCYESDKGTLIIEFTDGTKIELYFAGYFTSKNSIGNEPIIIMPV